MELVVSVIEIVGMVGAGKTTLAVEMVRLLEQRDYVVLSRVESIRVTMLRSTFGSWCRRLIQSSKWQHRIMTVSYRLAVRPAYIGLFAARNLGLVSAVVGSQALRQLTRRHRRTISKLFYRTGATLTFVTPRLHPREILVLEEGLHHRAVNLFSWDPDGVDADRVVRYLHSLPTEGLVVSVEAPTATCAARAASRGMPSRLNGQQAIEPDLFMANAAQIIDLVIETLQTCKKPTLRVWNGDTLDDAVAAMEAGLDAHFESMTLS